MTLPARVRLPFDRFLGAAACAAALVATWLLYDVRASDTAAVVRLLGTAIAVATIVAVSGQTRGTRIGILLLWGALGLAIGLGGAAIFSIGVVYLLAAAFIGATLIATPARSTPKVTLWSALTEIGAIGVVVVLLAIASP